MTTNNSLLSIIVPSYNHARYINECLAALEPLPTSQTEIIFIDDGSTDGTKGAIERYLASAPAAQNITQIYKPNGGLVSSLNLGLEVSRGDFIYIIASDDIPSASGISKLINILDDCHDAMFAIGGARRFTGNPSESKPAYNRSHLDFLQASPSIREKQIYFSYPAPLLLQSTIFRKSALDSINGWDSDLTLDDYPTFIKLLSKYPVFGKDFVYHPDVTVVHYRQHDSNSFKNVRRQAMIVNDVLARYCPPTYRELAISSRYISYAISAVKLGAIKDATYLLYCGLSRSSFLPFFLELIRTPARKMQSYFVSRQ